MDLDGYIAPRRQRFQPGVTEMLTTSAIVRNMAA
jgi:hypothetical protein